MKLPVPIRLLKERYFGEASRSDAFARRQLTELSVHMSPEAARIAGTAVQSLSRYQDPDYALLYLERLARYVGPKKCECPFLLDLATRIDRRMRFDDVAALAGQALERGDPMPDGALCLVDIVDMLPPNTANQITPVLNYLGLCGRAVLVRFDATTYAGRRKAGACALLKRLRTYSKRAKTEHALIERWLHMVDRTRLKQPEATMEVIRSVDIIEGGGRTYHERLERWRNIVDRVIKPACEGVLDLRDMPGAVHDAVDAAVTTHDRRQFDHLLVEIVRNHAISA